MAALGHMHVGIRSTLRLLPGALSTAIAQPRQSPPILIDLALLSLVVVCFALAMAYANLCDRLLARPADEDGGP
jgi:hypothetical protein